YRGVEGLPVVFRFCGYASPPGVLCVTRYFGDASPTPPQPMELAMAKRGRPRKSYQRKVDQPIAITPAEYGGLQEAFDHFNKALFDSTLPDIFLTYQRKANSLGYFGADRFAGRVIDGRRHELALNPDGFVDRSDRDICATLVHEQVHVWQHVNGTAPARG